VTGHSLGGALATFAILDLKETFNFSNPIRFYTFGSPRVGNQNFTNYFMTHFPGDIYQRVTNHIDAIAHIPPLKM
jgi:predicted lipase